MPDSSACGPTPKAEPVSSASTHFSSRRVRTSACRLERGYPIRSWSSEMVSRVGEAASASRMRTVAPRTLRRDSEHLVIYLTQGTG